MVPAGTPCQQHQRHTTFKWKGTETALLEAGQYYCKIMHHGQAFSYFEISIAHSECGRCKHQDIPSSHSLLPPLVKTLAHGYL